MPKYTEELVSQQIRRSELARKREEHLSEFSKSPIVTLSRSMGSGAKIIAQKLASELGWSMWDKELLDAIAEDASVSKRVVDALDEKTISEIEMMTRAALGDHELSGFMYAKHLARAVASIAKLGNAVILGRGSNILLPHAINVRIDASLERRIANMVEFEDENPKDAEKKILKSDKDREAFMIKMFGKEKIANFHHDLIIWTDEFSTDQVVQIVKAAVLAKMNHS